VDKSQGSPVSIVTKLWTGWPNLDHHWGPPNLLSSWYLGFLPWR